MVNTPSRRAARQQYVSPLPNRHAKYHRRMPLDTATTKPLIDGLWETTILTTLQEYVRIPNLSPAYDAGWASNGHMARAVALAVDWARARAVPGLVVEVVELPGRTPLVLLEMAGTAGGTVLLYGHLDKQPPFDGWEEGLGPFTPVVRDGKLYGRGAGDDGYALFAIVAAIEALVAARVPHPRLVAVVECCEESGSTDLPAYIEHLSARIGTPGLVVCLDSGCGDYERLWCTTSLRGLVAGDLRVEVLAEGIHSGNSGTVASSFRILRRLLDRLEDAETGRILPAGLHVDVPSDRLEGARRAAPDLMGDVAERLPLLPGMRPVSDDAEQLVLNRTWRPALSVTAQAGLPPLEMGGNVLRPFTAVKLSLRLPPTLPAAAATAIVKALLESDPPYGARVTFSPEKSSPGFNAPPLSSWLAESLESASMAWFGKAAAEMGEGGSIPFMSMLAVRFPAAQFVVTGVLGPHSNAHGPNEFLHLAMARGVTGVVASVLTDAAGRLG